MIIARRVLTFGTDAGEISIPIEISAPQEGPLGWCCSYSIAWAHETFSSKGYGFDAVQALLLTMQKIGTENYVSPYHRSGKLRWGEDAAGYGFPVPQGARDLLIGDDARFFG